MNKNIRAKKAMSPQSLLKSGFATRVVMVVSLVILISLLTSVPAQGSPTVITQSTFSGIISGDSLSYTGLTVTDVATSHFYCRHGPFKPKVLHRTFLHVTKDCGKGWKHFWGGDPGSFDLVDLTGGTLDMTTKWIESDGDTVCLVQHASSLVSGDTAYVSVTGVWSGTCDSLPDGATVLFDPIYQLWHQVGPNHVQITYVQHSTVDGQPNTLQIVKDVTYEGSAMLPYDEIGTISNIVAQFDTVLGVEHYEYDFTLAPASGSIPTLTEWGLIIFGVVLLGFISWVFVRRRKAVISYQ